MWLSYCQTISHIKSDKNQNLLAPLRWIDQAYSMIVICQIKNKRKTELCNKLLIFFSGKQLLFENIYDWRELFL